MSNEIHNVLEAMKALQDNQISSCKEMLKEKLISEESVVKMIETLNNKIIETLNDMQERKDKLDERSMEINREIYFKSIELNSKPKTFGETISDITDSVARGLEALSSASEQPIQKSKFS